MAGRRLLALLALVLALAPASARDWWGSSLANQPTQFIFGYGSLINSASRNSTAGKPTQAIDPDTASHVFAIPEIGLSVPLEGISSTAKNPCSNAPCSLSNDHHTISFTFRTPGPGLYRWQCYVPCAAGFIEGFGGPMQTVGYMDGFIKVV